MGADKTCLIDAGHPAIADHFPGDPVVPGVVILTELMAAVLESTPEGIAFTAVPRVKFLSPLRPGETLDLHWKGASDGVTRLSDPSLDALRLGNPAATRILDDDRRAMYRFRVASGGREILSGRASVFLDYPEGV